MRAGIFSNSGDQVIGFLCVCCFVLFHWTKTDSSVHASVTDGSWDEAGDSQGSGGVAASFWVGQKLTGSVLKEDSLGWALADNGIKSCTP